MKKCLLVRIPLSVAEINRDTLLQWGIFINSGQPVGEMHVSPVRQLYSLWNEQYNSKVISADDTAFPDHVVLLLPARWTLNRDLTVNSGQKKHIRSALPFLIEEEVASDIESLHICHVLPQKDNEVSITAIAHEKIKKLLALFEEEHISPDDFYSESRVIETVPQTAVIMLDEQDVTVAMPGHAPIPLAYDAVPFVLTQRSEQLNTEDTPLMVDEDNEDQRIASVKLLVPEGLSEKAEMQREALVQWLTDKGWLFKEEHYGGNAFDFYADHFFKVKKTPSTPLINLRQGEYQCPRRASRRIKQWLPLIIIFFAGVVINLGLFVGKGLYFSGEASSLWHDNADYYLKLYPNDKQVKDAKSRDRISFDIQRWLEQRLKNSGKQLSSADHAFLPLLKTFSSVALAQGAKTVEPKRMDFTTDTGRLLVEFQAPNLDVVNKMLAALKEQGLQTQLDTANQEKVGVTARVTVTR